MRVAVATHGIVTRLPWRHLRLARRSAVVARGVAAIVGRGIRASVLGGVLSSTAHCRQLADDRFVHVQHGGGELAVTTRGSTGRGRGIQPRVPRP